MCVCACVMNILIFERSCQAGGEQERVTWAGKDTSSKDTSSKDTSSKESKSASRGQARILKILKSHAKCMHTNIYAYNLCTYKICAYSILVGGEQVFFTINNKFFTIYIHTKCVHTAYRWAESKSV